MPRPFIRDVLALSAVAACALACASAGAPPEGANEAAPASQPAAGAPSPSGPAALGQHAPDFELAALDGSAVRLSGLRGQPAVVVFYRGTW